MTEMLALTAVGSALLSLTVYLLLLRTVIGGRRPVLALTRRWVAASPTTSGLVLAALIASTGLAAVLATTRPPTAASQDAGEMPGTPPGHAAIDEDADLSALRSFADRLDGGPTEPPEPAAATNLPGVDQMIDKLLQRLEREPGDVRGWKMLGWSYLNTGRAKEAAQAYETALKLAPSDSEIRAALETVRAAQAAPGGSETDKR